MGLAAKDAGLMLEAGLEWRVPHARRLGHSPDARLRQGTGLGGHDISDLVEVMERAPGPRC